MIDTLTGIALCAGIIGGLFAFVVTVWALLDFKGLIKKPGSYKQMYASVLKRYRLIK